VTVYNIAVSRYRLAASLV